MRQRIALSGLSITLALGLIFAWSVITAPVSAMERVGRSIGKAKSYKVKMITEVQLVRKPGEQPTKTTVSTAWYWLAPGSIRMDVEGGDNATGMIRTNVYPADKLGIHIDRKAKTYRRVSPRRGQMSPIMMLEGLRKYSGQADQDLGAKIINGKKALGFVIDAKKVDPDAGYASIEVWIDAETNLPTYVEIEMNNAQVPMTLRMEDFQWNLELDPKLFDATPPAGYVDATPEPPGLEKQVRAIVDALNVYAEFSGGHYPRVKMVYGDVTRDEMMGIVGIKGQPTPNQMRDKKYEMILKAGLGFAWINTILRDNSDAAYFGLTVGPKDNDEVLLRWKLDDGRFHVMYGDLRAETVTADRLKTLEGR